MKLGVDKAWLVGVAPFVVASLIKNALRAALVPEIRRVFDRPPIKFACRKQRPLTPADLVDFGYPVRRFE